MTKVTGDLISIDDSAYDGFKGMTVYGKTVQNLWVNPVSSGGNVVSTENANGSITVSGVQDSTCTYTQSLYTLKPSTVYVLICDKTVGSHPDTFFAVSNVSEAGRIDIATVHSGSKIFTVPPAAQIIKLCCTLRINAGDNASGTYRVMLREATPEEIAKAASTPQTLPVYPDGGPDASDGELGIMPLDVSTLADSDFDDYWCPPGLSSIDEVEVVTAGKNLFNAKESVDDVSGWLATELSDAGDGWIKATVSSGALGVNYVSDKFHFLSNTTYTLSLEAYATKDVRLNYNYIMKGGLTGNVSLALLGATVPLVTTTKQRVSITFRTKEEIVGNIMVGISSEAAVGNELYVRNLQLEPGSTATPYEPPIVKKAPIDLQTHSLSSLPDGTRDELQIDAEGNCTLVKRVAYEEFTADDFNIFDVEYVNAPGSYSFAGGVSSLSFTGDQINDFAVVRNVDGAIGHPGVWMFQTDGMALASCRAGTGKTSASPQAQKDEFDALLGSKTIKVQYAMKTPQTIQLGKISLPKLRKKPLVNNIWANGTASGTGFALAPEIDFEYNQWSTYCDGFKTHGKHSYFDMGCCIAARDTGTPEKKSVTATVPYMSGFYDLSKLYGAIAFEARQLMYRFEFVEDTREELQQKKSQFLEWLSQVHDEEIADDDIPGRHFIGSLSEWEFEEGEEGQSGSLEVTFNCQPFLEADEDTTKTCNAGSSTVTVEGQAVNAYAKTNSGTATIRIGGVTQSVGTTEIRLSVQLQPGDNAVTVTGSPVVLRWKELTA